MSTVNVQTLIATSILTANIVVGNSTSSVNVSANATEIAVENNVVIDNHGIRVGNTAGANTVANSQGVFTPQITVNGVTYTDIPADTPLIDYQVFSNPLTNNIWSKPLWAQANDLVVIMMWGGGGGGGLVASTYSGYGGGGGACVIANRRAGDCDASCNVVVGAGGRQVAGVLEGANSSFWPNTTFSVTAYGGARGGITGAVDDRPGGGGGWFSAGISGPDGGVNAGLGGGPLGGNSTAVDSTFGGASSNNSVGGGMSVYGGGGGGYSAAGSETGGSSIYGGGGGAGTGNLTTNFVLGGTSVFGGNGGAVGQDGFHPGGGGGGSSSTEVTLHGTASRGANGEVRVWTIATRIV